MTTDADSAPERSRPDAPAEPVAYQPHASDLVVGCIRVGLPLLMWSSLLVWLVWRVPVVMQAFDDFGVAPTFINQILFEISRWTIRIWPLLMPVLGLLGYTAWKLENKVVQRRAEQAAWRWFLLMSLFPLVLWAVAEFSLIGQLHQLLDEMTPR